MRRSRAARRSARPRDADIARARARRARAGSRRVGGRRASRQRHDARRGRRAPAAFGAGTLARRPGFARDPPAPASPSRADASGAARPSGARSHRDKSPHESDRLDRARHETIRRSLDFSSPLRRMNVPMLRAAPAALLLAVCAGTQAQPLAGSPSSAATANPAAQAPTRSRTPPDARSPALPAGSLASQTLSQHAPPDAKPQYTAPLQRNFAFAQDQSRQEECDELAATIDNLARHTQAATRSAPPALLAPSTANSQTPWKIPAPPVYEPPPSRPPPSANGHARPNYAPLPFDYRSRPWAQPYPATEQDAKEQRARSAQQIELETRYRQLHCRP
ncbi:hypothetical protein BURPS1710A_A1222 [Burkholderia pseudomallei 1710a]|uniref:Uncharacterized protein n=4 Tax=Burkholderia pseudomallei TaxID=28450 RepID=A0A0E1VTP8_BURPE|nr:hypothetical protein BURPS1710A_A1222 [Burkholderia pseudomallei 1710a]